VHVSCSPELEPLAFGLRYLCVNCLSVSCACAFRPACRHVLLKHSLYFHIHTFSLSLHTDDATSILSWPFFSSFRFFSSRQISIIISPCSLPRTFNNPRPTLVNPCPSSYPHSSLIDCVLKPAFFFEVHSYHRMSTSHNQAFCLDFTRLPCLTSPPAPLSLKPIPQHCSCRRCLSTSSPIQLRDALASF
jgi:hypothetical protein